MLPADIPLGMAILAVTVGPLPCTRSTLSPAGVILCSQLRTISERRVRGGPVGYLTDAMLRRRVRAALAHHLGLDIPAVADRV